MEIIFNENDSEEMVLLKQAILRKGVNLEDYKSRFKSDVDFNNNKRLLKRGNTITFRKLKELCNVFDLDCTLTLDTKNPEK